LVAEGYNPVADATTEEAADRAEETEGWPELEAEAEAAADVEDDVVTEAAELAAELAAEDEALLLTATALPIAFAWKAWKVLPVVGGLTAITIPV